MGILQLDIKGVVGIAGVTTLVEVKTPEGNREREA